LSIPVISNGGIRVFDDIRQCLDYTGCDGVMSAEALLNNPTFFSNIEPPDPFDITLEYLELCKLYPTTRKYINCHVYRMMMKKFLENHFYEQKYRKSDNSILMDVIKEFREHITREKHS